MSVSIFGVKVGNQCNHTENSDMQTELLDVCNFTLTLPPEQENNILLTRKKAAIFVHDSRFATVAIGNTSMLLMKIGSSFASFLVFCVCLQFGSAVKLPGSGGAVVGLCLDTDRLVNVWVFFCIP